MTKIQQKLRLSIPYQKYFIDSGKFYIDASVFSAVKVPRNFTLVDSDTGEAISNFKKNSLEIPYKDHKVYIALVKKQLKQITIDKVLIYFAAKVAGKDYFSGIQKHHFIEVLEHIRSIGYLEFKNAAEIYDQVFVKDLDIKMDFCFDNQAKDEIRKYNHRLKELFQGSPDQFHLFDSLKQGFGVSTHERDRASITRPFIKFYDKRQEMIDKNRELYDSFPDHLRDEIRDNLIYRYEFTLRDRTFFKKFEISNRLVDLHLINQDEWREIGRALMNMNFQVRVRKPKDMSALRPVEKLICLWFKEDLERGLTALQIRDKFVTIQKGKMQRSRMAQLYDRIVYHVAQDHAKEIRDDYEMIQKYHKLFGLVD